MVILEIWECTDGVRMGCTDEAKSDLQGGLSRGSRGAKGAMAPLALWK